MLQFVMLPASRCSIYGDVRRIEEKVEEERKEAAEETKIEKREEVEQKNLDKFH